MNAYAKVQLIIFQESLCFLSLSVYSIVYLKLGPIGFFSNAEGKTKYILFCGSKTNMCERKQLRQPQCPITIGVNNVMQT